MKKRIIVCGYPKSGNTWLTRLTAEIVGCPVAGFWCSPANKDIAIEGQDRESEYECYKAHHSIDLMSKTLAHYSNGTEKIIYIVRDPRDVIISGSHYFRFSPRSSRLYHLFAAMPYGQRVYKRWVTGLVDTSNYKLDIMTTGLIHGTREGAWLQVPWKDHVEGYLNSDALFMKYEDLKQNPLAQAKKVCAFLGISKSDDELKSAINAQSFENKKSQFIKSKKVKKANFLRKGTSGEWRTKLDKRAISLVEDNLGGLLNNLGYN